VYRRLLLATIATAFLALPTWAEWDRVKEDFRFSYKLAPNGRVYLEGINGSIDILGWDRDEAEVTGTKYASSDEILKSMTVNITNTADSVNIKVDRPVERNWWRNGGGGVKFVLRVPRKVQLERIASSNGSIRVESIEGSARLISSNGTIRGSGIRGSIDASTSNGAIELLDINGGMMLRTSNGTIRAENVRGSFEAHTSNGAIRARLDEVPPASPIRASSSNGAVELTLPNYKGNDVRANTSNSSITLRLPAAIDAQLRAATSNANVQTDYEVAMRGTLSKNRIEGKIGNGGALIDLTSSNGAIRIQKI